MNDSARRDFEEAGEHFRTLVQDRPRISPFVREPTAGIYMMYVDDCSDDHVIPAYVGKASAGKTARNAGVQRRCREHLTRIIALNRYSGRDYAHLIVETSIVDGHYLYPKVLKYMADHSLSLGTLGFVLLEECDGEDLSKRESWWIQNLKTPFFGFNQVNTRTMAQLVSPEVTQKLLKSDLESCRKYFQYGYTRFNFRYVLDDVMFLIPDKDKLYGPVRELDVDGDDTRARFLSGIDEFVDKAIDMDWPGFAELDSRTEQRLLAVKIYLDKRRTPRWHADLRREWRKDLLPRFCEYSKYPLGDRFSETGWHGEAFGIRQEWPGVECHLRFELSARSSATGKSSSNREPPRIIRVDYLFAGSSDIENKVFGGAFIDCDVTRNLADEGFANLLKAQVLKGNLHNYGWDTWACAPGLSDDDANAILWRNSSASKRGNWNEYGPTYSLIAEMGTGINGSSFSKDDLRPLDELLSEVIDRAVEENCAIIVHSNAVKKAVLDAIRTQAGAVPSEFKRRILQWREPVPRNATLQDFAAVQK